MSAKKDQSEAGVTGEVSPNYEMVEEIQVELDECFDHTHDTITDADCYLFISQMHLGNRIDDGGSHCMGMSGHKGCQYHIIEMLIQAMSRDEYLKEAILVAVSKVLE